MGNAPRELFVADNPWPLAAKAHAEGYETQGRFYELDGLPTDKVYVIDLDRMAELLGELKGNLKDPPDG